MFYLHTNTRNANQWALCNFQQQRICISDDPVPDFSKRLTLISSVKSCVVNMQRERRQLLAVSKCIAQQQDTV